MSVRMRRRLLAAMALIAGFGILAVANGHLLRVSFLSQPDCVSHLKAAGSNGQFRAAQSSC